MLRFFILTEFIRQAKKYVWFLWEAGSKIVCKSFVVKSKLRGTLGSWDMAFILTQALVFWKKIYKKEWWCYLGSAKGEATIRMIANHSDHIQNIWGTNAVRAVDVQKGQKNFVNRRSNRRYQRIIVDISLVNIWVYESSLHSCCGVSSQPTENDQLWSFYWVIGAFKRRSRKICLNLEKKKKDLLNILKTLNLKCIVYSIFRVVLCQIRQNRRIMKCN